MPADVPTPPTPPADDVTAPAAIQLDKGKGGASHPSKGRPARQRVDYQVARAALDGVAATPGVAKPDAVLVASGVRRSFGGLTAVDVDRLEVQRGVITGLIGPNGAGKTTLFNLLTGFDRPDTGSWSLEGRSLSGLPAHRVARVGLVRTFQLTKALSRLTVLENMLLGAQGQRGESFFTSLLPFAWRGEERANTTKALGLLERFGLAAKAHDLAGEMSGGQRKLLEMARALMTDPEVLCLDEPMAGVNPALTQSILTHVKTLREDGLTIVFVEHDMDVIRDVSDWVVAMAQGSVVAEGPPDTILRDPRVIDAYLGAHHDAPLSREEEEAILGQAAASIAAETGSEATA